MPKHGTAATGGNINTGSSLNNRPALDKATRNGESIRHYDNDPDFGQRMDEAGTRMYGSRPVAE